MVDGKLTGTEVALVGNLMPEAVDECRSMVTSTEVCLVLLSSPYDLFLMLSMQCLLPAHTHMHDVPCSLFSA